MGHHSLDTPDEAYIHEAAVVEPNAHVGRGTKIWHHCHVRSGASIGKFCQLGKNVYVDSGVVVGDFCRIQNNVSLYRGVTLENWVFVGPSAVFTNDLYPRAGSMDWPLVRTLVQVGASIGANATLLCGITIGSWAMVGAGALVTKDVAAHELVIGNPARRAGWVCECGQVAQRNENPLVGFTCASCGRAITVDV